MRKTENGRNRALPAVFLCLSLSMRLPRAMREQHLLSGSPLELLQQVADLRMHSEVTRGDHQHSVNQHLEVVMDPYGEAAEEVEEMHLLQ